MPNGPTPGGSPIIVGGGSVFVQFDHAHYDQNGQNHDHKDKGVQIDRVEITGHPPIQIDGKKVTIAIHLRNNPA